MAKTNNNFHSFFAGLKKLFGIGIYLLMVGILIEVLMIIIHKYVSVPISIPFVWQIFLSIVCLFFCFSGMIWFNKTLDLVEIYIAGGENKLMTFGPFNYVRHPLYATLMITLPPIWIIWFEDLLFVVPWILIFVIANYMIRVEERGLVRIFGDEYKKYKEYVPGLIPYKGSGGEKFRMYSGNIEKKKG